MEKQVRLENKEKLVIQERKALLAHRESRVYRVLEEKGGKQEKGGYREKLEIRGNKEKLARRVTQVRLE
jgi:hypothetical protein